MSQHVQNTRSPLSYTEASSQPREPEKPGCYCSQAYKSKGGLCRCIINNTLRRSWAHLSCGIVAGLAQSGGNRPIWAGALI